MFEIFFYRWRIFLQLRVRNEFTTRIQKIKSTGGMCFYAKQYFIMNTNKLRFSERFNLCLLEFQN